MVRRGEEMNQTVEYIKELTAIASPTGFTREITDYLVETLEKLGYHLSVLPKVVSTLLLKVKMMNNNAM